MVMGICGQGACVVYDFGELGVESGKVCQLVSPRLCKLGAELFLSLLPREAQAHHGLEDVACGLWVREGPKCGTRLA
eukprot:4454194-Pyramimonas_sp.AAC.1